MENAEELILRAIFQKYNNKKNIKKTLKTVYNCLWLTSRETLRPI